MIKAISELPNIVKNFEVPYENFNHMDFLYAMNVGEVLYPTLLEEMAKAANSTTGHNFWAFFNDVLMFAVIFKKMIAVIEDPKKTVPEGGYFYATWVK